MKLGVTVIILAIAMEVFAASGHFNTAIIFAAALLAIALLIVASAFVRCRPAIEVRFDDWEPSDCALENSDGRSIERRFLVTGDLADAKIPQPGDPYPIPGFSLFAEPWTAMRTWPDEPWWVTVAYKPEKIESASEERFFLARESA